MSRPFISPIFAASLIAGAVMLGTLATGMWASHTERTEIGHIMEAAASATPTTEEKQDAHPRIASAANMKAVLLEELVLRGNLGNATDTDYETLMDRCSGIAGTLYAADCMAVYRTIKSYLKRTEFKNLVFANVLKAQHLGEMRSVFYRALSRVVGMIQYLTVLVFAVCLLVLARAEQHVRADDIVCQKTREFASKYAKNLANTGAAENEVIDKLHIDDFRYEFFGDPYVAKIHVRRDKSPSVWLCMIARFLMVLTRGQPITDALDSAANAGQDAEWPYNRIMATERYLQWLIPGLGFLGTVYGLGEALDSAVTTDDMPAVITQLGVAFNTTLVALVLSIGLMWYRADVERRKVEVWESMPSALDSDWAKYFR